MLNESRQPVKGRERAIGNLRRTVAEKDTQLRQAADTIANLRAELNENNYHIEMYEDTLEVNIAISPAFVD